MALGPGRRGRAAILSGPPPGGPAPPDEQAVGDGRGAVGRDALPRATPAGDRAAAERDDAALVLAARADPAAFAALYARYAAPVYRYCRLRLSDPATAEDAAGLTFARALAGLPRCRPETFRAWLFAIAHNVVADRHREGPPPLTLDAAADAVAALPDGAPGPEAVAIARDELGRLRAHLAALPPDQRRVIELRLAGLTGPEIAAVVGRSHGATKKLQGRAIARLRVLLGVGADEPGPTRPRTAWPGPDASEAKADDRSGGRYR